MAIPYASPSFDSVVSCLGVMFERHHQTVAKEQLRMTTPRGRIALLSGTPRPLAGWRTSSTPSSRHRRRQRRASHQRQELDRFANPPKFPHFVRQSYGPTSAANRKSGDNVAELDHAVVDLARDHMTRRRLMQWEYLLLTAHRAG